MGAITAGSLSTGCKGLALSNDDDYYFGGYGTILTEWRWTAYPVPKSLTEGLSKGAIAAIVISVLLVCGLIGFYVYRRILFKRQLQNSLLDPLTAVNSSTPVPTTAARIPTGTIIRVTQHNPSMSNHDFVPNPLVATPVQPTNL